MPFLQLKVCNVVFKFYKTSDIKSTVQLERVLCEDLQHVQQQDQMRFLDYYMKTCVENPIFTFFKILYM